MDLKAVLFDFDGTLVDYVTSDIHSLQYLHTCINTSISFDDFLGTAVDEIMRFHQLVEQRQIDPLLMHEFRLKNTFQHHNLPWNDVYITVYQEQLLSTCHPFDGVNCLLADIHSTVKTGLISNAYDAQEQNARIQNSGLASHFDAIVIAGAIGVYKPGVTIFLHTLNMLNVTPEQALYIGDSITHDIAGANAVGMKTVLFNQHKNRTSHLADYAVTGTIELHALLESILE